MTDTFLTTTELDDGWDIGGTPNGGYVMMQAARAMLGRLDKPDPLSVTAHFLRRSAPGPLQVETSIVKAGRTTTVAMGSARQGDVEVLRLLGTFGDLDQLDGPEHITGTPPVVGAADARQAMRPRSDRPFPPGIAKKIDQAIDPPTSPFIGGAAREAEVRGWIRYADETPPDACSMLLFADGYPPPFFNLKLGVGWVPTVELTVHLRRRPTTPWHKVSFTSRFVFGGMVEEDGEIWDENDNLIALSRQLALTPTKVV